MKEIIVKYVENHKDTPEIGIVFCGTFAIASIRENKKAPREHKLVSYGYFFWLRLAFACAGIFRRLNN